MKYFIVFLFNISLLHSANLIYISNDINKTNLDLLYKKYHSDIIIDSKKAYLAPRECLIDRYFGGESETKIIIPKSEIHTRDIVSTQEVFEAKDNSAIDKQFEKKNSINLLVGDIAKGFLQDEDGRKFAGITENMDYLVQLIEKEKTLHIKKNIKQVSVIKNATLQKNRRCKLLDDGSGYKIYTNEKIKIYSIDGIRYIPNGEVLFY